SINAHGSSLTGQAITFTATVGLTDELKTSGLADVTVNGTYSAKSMDLEADESFTLAGNSVLCTRKIAARGDPLTAPSTGDTGDLPIESSSITVNPGSKLLAQAEEGSSFKAGKVSLDAQNTTNRQATQLSPPNLDNLTATISVSGATIRGADIKLKTTAAVEEIT